MSFVSRRALARLLLVSCTPILPAMAADTPTPDGETPQAAPLVISHGKPEQPAPAVAQPQPAALQPALKSATPADTAALLGSVPGVSLNSAGGLSSLPSIRGLADDRLRIQVDGMDLIASCPNHMNPALSTITPDAVGALEVFAGISPVSLGGDSIGGSIIATSAPLQFAASGDSQTHAQLSSSYRSNDYAQRTAAWASYAEEDFSLRYDGAHAQADNYNAAKNFKTFSATGRPGKTLSLDEVGSSAYRSQTQQLSGAVRLGEDLLELRLAEQHTPEEGFPNQRMDLTDNQQQSTNLRYLARFSWGELDTRVYHERVDHDMDFGDDKQFWYGDAPGMPMKTHGRTTGAKVQANIDLDATNLLRVGSEYQAYELNDFWPPSGTSGMMDPNTFLNINDGERNRIALFGEWEGRWNPAWTSLLGVRYEQVMSDTGDVVPYNWDPMMGMGQNVDALAFNAQDHQKTDHNWDATALARQRASANLDIEYGLARKVRSPNLYERYTWSSFPMMAIMNNLVGDGNGYVGDLDLKPETAYTASTRFDLHSADGQQQIALTPFYTHVDNYIDAIAAPGTTWQPDQFNVLQYANQTAELYGFDLSGQLPLAQNDLGRWQLDGLINYSHTRNRDTGDALYNTMPLNAKLVLSQQVGNWQNALEMVSVAAKQEVSDIRNEIQTAGYTLFNLRASHNWEQVRVDVGVENLLNKFYYLPTGGTYTGQGSTMGMNLSMMGGIPWGIGVPGMGRAYYTGVTLGF